MAAPTVAGTPATTSDQTAATSHTVNLPASIAAGETLLLIVGSKAPTGEAAITGWTRFVDVALVSGSNASVHAFWKKATGSEGATATLTFTTTSTRITAVAYRIAGASDPTVTAPEGATATGVNTINPDPPAITPAGGSKDYLVFAAFASSAGRITSVVPTNYGDSQTAGPNNGTVTNVGMGVADRALTAATTENPGTFTTTGAGTEETASATIAVYPSAGTAWTKTVTESVGALDGATRVVAFTRPKTDTVGGLDSIVRLAAFTRPKTDTVGLLDSASKGYGKSSTDPVGLLDSVTRLYAGHRTVTDPEGLLDAATRVVAFVRAPGDQVGVLDSIVRLAAFLRSRTDPVGLLDSASHQLSTGGTPWTKTATDAVGLLDAATRTVGYGRSIVDPVGGLDAVVRLWAALRAPSDQVGLLDGATRLYAGHRIVVDPVGGLDAIVRLWAAHRAVTDPEGLVDGATHQLSAGTSWTKTATDAVGLLDAATHIAAYLRAPSDQVGLLDSRLRSFGKGRTDPVGMLDGATRQGGDHRVVVDPVGLVDLAVRVWAARRVLVDVLGITDAATVDLIVAQLVFRDRQAVNVWPDDHGEPAPSPVQLAVAGNRVVIAGGQHERV